MIELTLLTQEQCGYCDDAKALIARLSGDFPITLTVVALDSEEGTALARTGGVLFPPGLFVDGDPAGYGRISERRLRRQLRQRVASC